MQDETCLRHAAFECIYEKQNAVSHIQYPFHLSTEVAMARSVDNIDLHTLIGHGYVLCEDGDASFPLNVIVVENQLAQVLRLTDQVSLVDHPVHEGGLAVVDMRDKRYISNFLHILYWKNPTNLQIFEGN